jgi:NAD(P)-dependent dehydrogenase (short-subunit alcohol dehydrogenase family)
VLITGGARGVTAELACALARSGGPSLVVVGRSPQPQPEPPELQALEGAKALKSALAAARVRPTPQEIEVAYRRVIADREITANLARIRAAGSAVEYHSVDVRDAAAVGRLIDQLAKSGAITGLVHGAGVIADRLIEDKSDDEMRAVLDTKVGGFENLLVALGDAPLRAIVAFSSTTARFGRRGQSDYAMANEQLNKRIGILQIERPSCRCLAVNWGPWDGGMVTSAHEEIFAAEGIKLVGCSEGAEHLVAELASGDDATETVVVGANSAIDAGPRPQQTAHDTSRESETLAVVFVQDLNTEDHHFLRNHVLDGHGVLPLAIIIEWLAHAALHNNPGLRFSGIDDLRVLKGVRVGAGESLRVRLCAGELDRQTNGSGPFVVRTLLESGGNNGQAVRHASATIVLTDCANTSVGSQLGGDQFPSYSGDMQSVYGEKLFHGSALHGIRSVLGCGPNGIAAQVKTAPLPSEWMRKPVRGHWITEPMAIDCAFQLAILWCLEEHGRPSLPAGARRFRQFREFSREDVRVVMRTRSVSENGLRADIEWIDADGNVIAAMEDYVCTMASSLVRAFERNQLSAPPVEA